MYLDSYVDSMLPCNLVFGKFILKSEASKAWIQMSCLYKKVSGIFCLG